MQAREEDDSVVDLNVGGALYSTTRTTLLRHDSMLTAMFSGRHELKRRADGRIFIDRDGELFKYVLQYLRDGDLDVENLNQGPRKRLKREAAFYCLPGLEEKLADGSINRDLPRSIYLRVTVAPSIRAPGKGFIPEGKVFTVQGSPWDIIPQLPLPTMTIPSKRPGNGYWSKMMDQDNWWWNEFIPALLSCFSSYHLADAPRDATPSIYGDAIWFFHLNRL
jgi:hypothetical protein